MGCLSFLLLAVLVAEASGMNCRFNCDPVTGLTREELIPIHCLYQNLSQCNNPSSCDDSTPGTGHKLFGALTEDLIAVERCYSFCYSNVTGGSREGNVTLFAEDLYREPACSDKWKAGHVCFSACLFALGVEAVFYPNDTIANLVSDPNTTCSDFCSVTGGICDRAFPPDVDSGCIQQCHSETCPQYCQLVESSFPSQSSDNAVAYQGTLELSLDYTSNVTLKMDGVMEFQISYVPPPPPHPHNSTLPLELAYGLIWKVTYSEGGQTVEQYISQHLPFLLLPEQVGPLYRIGSNMLAIRELQCREDVHLSYALVNKHGRGPFTTMQPQCFYGSWAPIPPDSITTKLGFDYSTGELRLEITSDDLSPDHKYVTGYRVQTILNPVIYDCPSRLNSTFTVFNDVAFADKESLSLVIRGTEEVEKFFPLWKDGGDYLVGVYALPQRNRSATKDFIYPVANWKAVHVSMPDYAKLQGDITYAALPDPFTGLFNVTYTFNVTSHWSSLAVYKSVFGRIPNSMHAPYHTIVYNITPSQAVYFLQFQGLPPLENNDMYQFTMVFTSRYEDVPPPDVTSTQKFPLHAVPPSPVKNLSVVVDFSQAKGNDMVTANLSWIAPAKPYGKICRYVIVISTPKIETLYSGTVDAKDTVYADNLTAIVVHAAEFSYVEGEDYYNFSVRAVSQWKVDGEVNTVARAPSPGAVHQSIEPYLISIAAAVGGLLLIAFVTVGIIGLCCCKRRETVVVKPQQKMEERTLVVLHRSRESTSSSDEWEVDPNHVYMKEKLGEGSFGEVYRAHITEEVDCVKARRYLEAMSSLDKSPSPCTVAVKLLKSNAPGETLQSFLNEISMMKKVAQGDNVHIVKMVGCVSAQSPYALLLEYVPYGSLLDYLRENRKLTQKRREIRRAMQQPLETTQYPGSQEYDENNGYLSDGQLEQGRALPYMEPVTLNTSSLQPVSQSRRIPSPTPERHQMDASKCAEPTPVVDRCASSVATNPLYIGPELQDLYVNLGELDAMNLMMFAYQIASGMEYLASLGIVHRDLACRNVLVDRSKILKISDFGLSRESDIYVCSPQSKLPLRWMSPEAISERIFTEKSDVWAYGVTIWEICTLGGFPYATTPNKELLPSLCKGYRMARPGNCSEPVYRMMMNCWQMQPGERPTFKQLKSHLDSLLMTLRPNAYITLSEIDDDNVPYHIEETISDFSEDDVFLSRTEEFDADAVNCTLASMGSACYLTTKPETRKKSVPAENGGIHLKVPLSPQIMSFTDDAEQNAPDHGVTLTAHSSTSTIRDASGDEETEV